jgi:glutamate synthase (ferredoxin)
VDFEGSAGQSFAFATNGLSFKIHGNCNDYLGKVIRRKLIGYPTATLNLRIISLVT